MVHWDAVASIFAASASAIIAGVALTFSYRQNVGWAPIAFIERDDLDGARGAKRFIMRLKLELWNRRKYAIVLKKISVNLSGIEAYTGDETRSTGMIWTRSYGTIQFGNAVAPADRYVQDIEIQFAHEDVSKLRASYRLTISYFDPVKNKTFEIVIKRRFMNGLLGWCGDDQRGRRRKLTEHIVWWAEREAAAEPMKDPLGS